MEDKAKTSIEDSLRGERLMKLGQHPTIIRHKRAKTVSTPTIPAAKKLRSKKWTDGLQDSNFRNLKKEKRKSENNRTMNFSKAGGLEYLV